MPRLKLVGLQAIWTFLALTCALPALHAAVIQDIVDDFQPTPGYVVIVQDEEVIIDLDASHGIVPGDIFSVIKTGKKITHPVTGKLLGTLEEVKGMLRVVRIKKGFSFARPIGDAKGIKRGDVIRRFDQMKAIFWDYTKQGRELFKALEAALPSLQWEAYENAQKNRPSKPELISQQTNTLYFVYDQNRLEVRDLDFNMLHVYEITSELAAAPVARKPIPAPPAITPAPATPPAPAEPGRVTTAPTFKPDFEEAQIISTLPLVTVMSDFVRHNGNIWLAATDGTTIDISEVGNNLKPLTRISPILLGQILTIKWWQPANQNQLYLAVTVYAREKVNGSIYRFSGSEAVLVQSGIRRILGTFDLDSDQQPETLLGQRMDRERFYGKNVREITLAGSNLELKAPPIKIPRNFRVIGSAIADLTNDGKLETAFINASILHIFAGKKQIYRSPKEMGGSLSFLYYDIDSGFSSVQNTTASFEVSPVVADLDSDGSKEILAIASERNIIGNVNAAPGIRSSWMVVLKYQDNKFVHGTLGEKLSTPIQGMMVDNEKLYYVVTEPGGILGRSGNSHLQAYYLAR
ncbi:MAG: hypothetical protein QNI92_00590 [Desulfobacterales bacterium]|nr:hypothetical protein [Desulfobacterales bacterium]